MARCKKRQRPSSRASIFLVAEKERDDLRIAALELIDRIGDDLPRLRAALRPFHIDLPAECDRDARRDLLRRLRREPPTDFATACRLRALEQELQDE